MAAVAVGMGAPADAALCPPLASASITAPSGTVTAGSSVHVSAHISGLMLAQAHLQISGPGLNKQVGPSVATGDIKGDVTVPKAGYFTLAVIGNGTRCAYATDGFSAKEKAGAPKPTHHSTPGRTPVPDGTGGTPGGAGAFPGGNGGAGGNSIGLNPLNGASPFSLPSVAPDGSGLGFQYPTPDPQVASPPARPVARNISQTTPVNWGESLAVALVLLVISAHLGMWARRQRLATEGARSERAGRLATRKKAQQSATAVAETSGPGDGAVADSETGAVAGDGTPGDAAGNDESHGRPTGRSGNHGRRRRA
jgi:hypothetical protein